MLGPTLLKLPPRSILRQRIEELKRMDLPSAKIDLLRSRINLLFKGYSFVAPVWPQGQIVFRGRKLKERPTNVSQLKYPPAHLVTKFQRASRPGRSMFYCSLTKEPAIFELTPEPEEHLAISRWRFKVKMLATNVGFAEQTFTRLGAARPVPSWSMYSLPNVVAQRLISKFLAAQFTIAVPAGEEYRYKFSAAIAEELYQKPVHLDDDAKRDGVQFGGLHYPTIAMRANSDNLALLPNFVDDYLDLASVDWIRIDAKKPDFKYDVTYLDFANSFGADGSIEWKGRRSQWKLEPGEAAGISVEDGRLVARNINGALREPE